MAIAYTWAVTDMKVRNETVGGTTYDDTVVQTFWEKPALMKTEIPVYLLERLPFSTTQSPLRLFPMPI